MGGLSQQFLFGVSLTSDLQLARKQSEDLQDNAKSSLQPGTNSKFSTRMDSSDRKSTQPLICNMRGGMEGKCTCVGSTRCQTHTSVGDYFKTDFFNLITDHVYI